MPKIQRGDIYWVDLNPTKGSEINKVRPALIVSATPINEARRTVIVIPISSSAKTYPPITVPIFAQNQDGVAVIDQIRAIDKSRLRDYIRTISNTEMDVVEGALTKVLALTLS